MLIYSPCPEDCAMKLVHAETNFPPVDDLDLSICVALNACTVHYNVNMFCCIGNSYIGIPIIRGLIVKKYASK